MTLFEAYRRHIPSPQDINKQAINRILRPHYNEIEIKRNFSNLVEKVQEEAYRIYLRAEEQAGKTAIREYLTSRISDKTKVNDVIEMAASMFGQLDKFFLSLTQSRRPRAGGAFEYILKTLFRQLRYPFEEGQVINGKPDFLMPSKAYYDRNAMDCIIFTAKRSIRERWRQIVTEGTRGLGFFLATIDDSVSAVQLEEMRKNRIHLVVPESVKERHRHYRDSTNVITFEEFFQYNLDPAVSRWKKRGVI